MRPSVVRKVGSGTSVATAALAEGDAASGASVSPASIDRDRSRIAKGLSAKSALDEARRRLAVVQMEDFGDRYPAALGDGMRKRVAIARALTVDPTYVLFDEPTSSLDPVSARRVDKLIRELSDKLGVTSIVVSHDLSSIFSIADRIVMLYQGKVRLLGTPADFQRTGDGVVDQFVHGRAHGPME